MLEKISFMLVTHIINLTNYSTVEITFIRSNVQTQTSE